MFLLFTYMHFGSDEFYEGGPRVSRSPMKWSATVESLINTALKHAQLGKTNHKSLTFYFETKFLCSV
jgi:hypothetical protein